MIAKSIAGALLTLHNEEISHQWLYIIEVEGREKSQKNS